MVSSAPNSPRVSASRSRQDTGPNLLQELEALSQALYKASQAQNVISGGLAGPSPTKDHHHQLPHPASTGLQRREPMALRTIDGFGKYPSLGGGGNIEVSCRRTSHVRHSISARPSAPLYEEHDQEELGKHPKLARHSIASAPRPLAPLYGHPEEEETLESPRFERKLQPWHSQGFEKHLPEVTNFPEWLEDNINFSRKLEAEPERKKSIWNWKPFRSLSHIGHTRYNCLFTVHVHAVEGLPPAVNGLRLTVHWRHKDRAVQTMPSRVFQGSAEFEETLQLRCSVYGSKGAHNAVKFMPKAFTLCVIALDVDELVLGQHRLDLSRLLPEEALDREHEDDDKPLSWTTSFKLAGKAKGGTLVVTFGYELLHRERGDKSGRFGSVLGSPSPSMASPSLRSFSGGGCHSTHGTPRPRPADDNTFLSPTLSEPGDYHDYMAMEHLNLDESPRSENGSGVFGENSTKGFRTVKSGYQDHLVKGVRIPYAESESNVVGYSQLNKPILAPPTPRQTEEPAEPKKEPDQDRNSSANDSSGNSDEDDQEFIVVDQGVEVGTLPDNIHYLEHGIDDGSVNCEDLGKELGKVVLEQNFSLAWPAVAAEGEEDKVILPDFHAGEEILGSFAVRSITEREKEIQEGEEGRSEDVVDEVRHWDPLRKFECIRKEPVQELNLVDAMGSQKELVQELKLVDAMGSRGRLDEGEPYGEEQIDQLPNLEGRWKELMNHRPAEFWDLRGKHQLEYTSEEEEGVQETVNWKTPVSLPYRSILEDCNAQRDFQEKVEVRCSSINAASIQWQPKESEASTSHNQSIVEDLDNEVDLIAGDFLSMLEGSERGLTMGMSSDSENDSPRALLLRQFEQEALLEGGIDLRLDNAEIPELNLDEMAEGMGGHHADQLGFSAFNSDGVAPRWHSDEDEELASIMEAAESELQKATQTMRSKTRAKMLEDAETEALMQEWGLNERAFETSPPKPAPVFVDIVGSQMVKVPTEAPVLAQGVGPVVKTRDGGMLRSMTSSLFSQTNASGKLVMQVSKPAVLPSEMGSSGLDVFRRLASGGVESMALQAMVAMPLEDITGKSIHQIAYESKAALEGPSYGQAYPAHPPTNGFNVGSRVPDTGRRCTVDPAIFAKSRVAPGRSSPVDSSVEYVSLEEIAPMAMQKIEALAMDGLKIQADMSNENAPFSVDSLPWADSVILEGSQLKKKGGARSLDGVAAMHLLDSRSFSDDVAVEVDGLMSKVISIDEWMRLDAGLYDEYDTKDETLAILAAHGVVHKDVVAMGSQEDRMSYLQGAKASANFGKGGFMGNTLTIAVLIQLRDPLRYNEPVGAPMMALVQAERLIVPPRPKIARRSPSLLGNSEAWVEEEETCVPTLENPSQPKFKITAVHMSGLKMTDKRSNDNCNKKRTWGNQKQQQSGSRWLAANGMGKSANAGSKLSILKSRPKQEKDITAIPGESLWSISARVHGSGSKWKEVVALNPNIRNPDVIFANQKIRTR